MKKILFFLGIFLCLLAPSSVLAQSPTPASSPEATQEAITLEPPTQPSEQFFLAKVLEAKDQAIDQPGYESQPLQQVKLKITSGSEKGKEIEVVHGGEFAISESQKVKVGQTVVINKIPQLEGELYAIIDPYRVYPLIIIFGFFLALAVIFGKMKGLGSIAGLVVSILILVRFVAPQIMRGGNPLLMCLAGAIAIAILSLYLAHGLSRRTTIALVSTIITLLIAVGLSMVFASFASLYGMGTEEAYFLRMGPFSAIDLKGLFLGGILIGVLGVLDDVTTSQAAAVDEIRRANSKLSKKELFKRGISVGQEHIASLVNTLALAYAGASFPLLLLFSFSNEVPFWVTLNSEFIAEEVVRTLVGSIALVLAVPISTFLAAQFLTPAKAVATSKKKNK